VVVARDTPGEREARRASGEVPTNMSISERTQLNLSLTAGMSILEG